MLQCVTVITESICSARELSAFPRIKINYCMCCKNSGKFWQAAVEYFKMCMPQLEHEESAANPQIWQNVKVKVSSIAVSKQ